MPLPKQYQSRAAFTAYATALYKEGLAAVGCEREDPDDLKGIAEANEADYVDHDLYSPAEKKLRAYLKARLQKELRHVDLHDEAIVSTIRAVSRVSFPEEAVSVTATPVVSPGAASKDAIVGVVSIKSRASFFRGKEPDVLSSGDITAQLTPVLEGPQQMICELLEEILAVAAKPSLLRRLGLRK